MMIAMIVTSFHRCARILTCQNLHGAFCSDRHKSATKTPVSQFAPSYPAKSMIDHTTFLRLMMRAAILAVATASAQAQDEGPKHISDNSFLVEEAYNQEPGVVQHIFNWIPTWDFSDGQRRDFTFLYYRYQLTMDDEDSLRPAIAPRATLILPTGDEDRGLGTGEVGYQFNLPISKELERFAFHFNAGTTFFPDASVELAGGGESPGQDLNGYHVGGSVIWLATYDVNFLVEFLTLWDDELDDLGNVNDTTTVLLNPGVRGAVYTGEEVQWVVGLGVPIGLSDDAPDMSLFIYMSVEHNFRRQ